MKQYTQEQVIKDYKYLMTLYKEALQRHGIH